jgi:hypothetical protein
MPLEEALHLANACLNRFGSRRRMSRCGPPVMRWVAGACGVLLVGAGLGFVARELLRLGRPVVAIAWVVGVAAELGREREPRAEDDDRRAS